MPTNFLLLKSTTILKNYYLFLLAKYFINAKYLSLWVFYLELTIYCFF